MDDIFVDWSNGDGLMMEGSISGGVPIPRHQQQSHMDHLHSNGTLLSRVLHSNTSIATSVSSDRYIGSGGIAGSPYQQNCPSPGHQPYQQNSSPTSVMNTQHNQNTGFRTHNDGILYHDTYNSMGLSPLPTNSPSPHMWQAQSMDLESDVFNIKLEPLEMLGKDGNLLQNNSDQNFIDDFDLLSHGSEDMMYQDNYLDEIISGNSMIDPTCLDPQHSSPAAMAAVRPNEVMGIGPHSSSHSADSSNSVSSLSRLVIQSSELKPDMSFHENQDRLFTNNQCDMQQLQQHQSHPQEVQHSQSFTDSSFLNAAMGGNMSSGLLSGGSVKIEPSIESSDSFMPSSFPPNSAWRDSFSNNASLNKFQQSSSQDLGSDQNFGVNRNSSPGPSTSLHFRDQPADSLEQLLKGGQRPQSIPNSVLQKQQLQHQQQIQLSQRPQISSLQHNYVLQNHQLAQLHKLQQQTQFVKTEDQSQQILKNFDQHSVHLPRHFHQQKPLSPTQQLVHQQKHQIPLKSSPQQQIPMPKDIYASSFPSTPNNTPVQSGLFMGSTLKEMLQSPTSIASPISPQSASSPISSSSPLPVYSPGTANSPRMTQSPFHLAASPSNPLCSFDDPQSFVPVGQSVPTNNVVPCQFPSGSSNASRVRLKNSLQFTHGNQLSSSAPAPNMLEQIWGRREPRKHLLSTGSLAEEQFGGSSSSLGLPSPAPELSIDESCLDSDEESEINYDSDSDNETVMGQDPGLLTSGGTSNKSSTNNNNNANRSKERHFWQYNVQAKGPKGQRVSLEPHLTDPHQLVTVADPVFSEDVCSVQGIKHSGKARRGDGNDLSPNPSKLVDIGKQLNGLNKTIMDMTPVSEQPFHIRPKSRKEKNKLASRACRLKKKAQHEANKIKLYGLGEEHKFLLLQVRQCRAILAKKFLLSSESSNDDMAQKRQLQLTERLCAVASTKPFRIAGQTTDFVNNVIDKCRRGRSNGGLDELTQCLDALRTSGSTYCEGGGDGGGNRGESLETVTDYMAEFA